MLCALDDALVELALVDSRRAKVIELRFFGGLSVEETARRSGSVAADGQCALAAGEGVAGPAAGCAGPPQRNDGIVAIPIDRCATLEDVAVVRRRDVSEAAHRWCEIEQICEAALARPAVDRDAFLRGACGNDADLRQQVDAVIAQAARAERFLEQPVAAVSALILDPVPDAGADRVAGWHVDHWSTDWQRRHGSRFSRARDAELDREVAVKVLLPEHAG